MSDPGPVARFVQVVEDPTTPGLVVQRLTAGETLGEIADAWGVPRRRFIAWVAANEALSEQCKRALELTGIELRLEGMEILDAAGDDKAAVSKAAEQAKYRERLSRDFHRALFGRTVKHEHAHTVDLGERLRRARERVVEALPEPATPAHELI